MTVSSTPRKAGPFAGNGVTTAFPFGFKVFDKTDIQAIYSPLTGNAVTWVLDSDYSITLNPNQDSNPGGTLSVITPPPLGTSLAMIGALVAEQATDITNAGRFLPQVVEDSLDKLTILVQQLLEVSGRTLQAAVGSTLSLVFPAPSAGKFLRWRGDLLGLENAEAGTDSMALQGLLLDSTVATRGSAMIGYDGATAQVLLDEAKTMQSYAALRAYTGRATGVRLTSLGVAGQFYRDVADVSSTDNGGTVILDALNRRWKRIFTGSVDVTWFGAAMNGSTDDTAALVAAMSAAVVRGVGVSIPDGTLLTGPFTIPAGLKSLRGQGISRSAITFKTAAYSAGQRMIDARNNTGKLSFGDVAINVDGTGFNSTWTMDLTGGQLIRCSRINLTGSGANGLIWFGGTDISVDELNIVGTNAGFTVGVYGNTQTSPGYLYSARAVNLSGVFGYGVQFGGNGTNSSKNHRISNCSGLGNVGASFTFSLDRCDYSEITGCYARDSSREAFQLTNTNYCTISDCEGEWTTLGSDFGMSINGTPGINARFNKLINCTLVNSYSAAAAVADSSQYNKVIGITARECGRRSTIDGGGSGAAAMFVSYTETAAGQCLSNEFIDCTGVSETGATTYGYAEFVGGGGGAAVASNTARDLKLAGTTSKYLLAGSTALVYDLDWQPYVPTITASSGTLTAASVISAQYIQRGKDIHVELDLQITTNGTGAGAVNATLPFIGATGGGVIPGRETAVSGLTLSGTVVGSLVGFSTATNGYPGANGARIQASGIYRAA